MTLSRRWRLAAGLLLALVAAAGLLLAEGRGLMLGAIAWVRSLGPAGAAVYVCLYIVACILLVPGSLLTLGAGFLYGVGPGTALVSVASTLGATAAFLLGRYVARDRVARALAAHPRFAALDAAVADQGFRLVLLTRLSPLFPFNLLNYAYGLTRIPVGKYVLASWVGMLPGAVVYVYLGSLAADLAALGTVAAPTGAVGWVVRGAGLLATVAATVVIARLARSALGRRLAGENTPEEKQR